MNNNYDDWHWTPSVLEAERRDKRSIFLRRLWLLTICCLSLLMLCHSGFFSPARLPETVAGLLPGLLIVIIGYYQSNVNND